MTPHPSSSRRLFSDVLKGSGSYSITLIAQRLSGFVLLPVMTHFLLLDDYGRMEIIEQVGVITSLLLGVSFAGALGFFYNESTNEEYRRDVVGTTLFGAFLLGVLAAAVGLAACTLFGGRLFSDASLVSYLLVIFCLMPVSFLLEALNGWLRVEDRRTAFTVSSIARLLITVAGILILLPVFHLRVWGVLSANIISGSVVTIGLMIYWLRLYRPRLRGALFLRMLRFSIPAAVTGICLFVVHFGDRFIIPRYHPMSELGIYSLAYKIGMMVNLAHIAFHSYWSAQVYAIMKREDANAVFGRIFTYMMLILAACALTLVFSARPVLRIMAPPSFFPASALVPLIVAAYVARAVGDFFRCLFLVENRPGSDAICNVAGLVVCLVLYFSLIPPFGIWGASIATLVTFVVIAAIAIIWTYQLRPYLLEAARLVKIGVLAVGLISLHYAFAFENLPMQIVSAAALLALFPVGLWMLRFLTPGEWRTARSALDRLPWRRSAVGIMQR